MPPDAARAREHPLAEFIRFDRITKFYGALCVVEEAASALFDPGPDFAIADQRSYGETVIRFLEIR